MVELIIFGTSSFAKQMYFYFESSDGYTVIGFALDAEYISEDNFCGLPIYSTEKLLKLGLTKNVKCFMALGYKNMRARQTKFEQLRMAGINFVSYISPYAVCQIDVEKIGDNSIVLANTTIEPFAKIDENVFIWSGVTICHDVIINSHSFIAAGSLIGGNSVIGKNCFLGFNSTVSNNVILADETLLAANSFIQTNSEAASFYAGSPAIKKSSHISEGIKVDGN